MAEIKYENLLNSDSEVIVYSSNSKVANQIKRKYPRTYRRFLSEPKDGGTVLIFDATPLQKHAVLYADPDSDTYATDLVTCVCELRDYVNDVGLENVAFDYDLGNKNEKIHKGIEKLFGTEINYWREV